MDNKLSELKVAALAATPGPWVFVDDDWSDGDHANITSAERSDSSIIDIAQVNGGGTASDFDEPFRTEQQANTAFIAAANPATVLTLLAKLEEANKRIAELEAELSEMTTFRDNALNKALRYWEELLELRAKLATPVRLPEPDVNDYGYESIGYRAVLSALSDAGFTVEGDE